MNRVIGVVFLCLAAAVGGLGPGALAMGSALAHGEETPNSVSEALDVCTRGMSDLNSRHAAVCNTLLRVVHDAHEHASAGRPELRKFCPPKEAPPAALRDAFIEWARKNPAVWHKADILGVVSAWSEAYPCK